MLQSRNAAVRRAQEVIRRTDLKSWLPIPARDVYRTYLRTVQQVVANSGGALDLQTAEMILFARAEELAIVWH